MTTELQLEKLHQDPDQDDDAARDDGGLDVGREGRERPVEGGELGGEVDGDEHPGEDADPAEPGCGHDVHVALTRVRESADRGRHSPDQPGHDAGDRQVQAGLLRHLRQRLGRRRTLDRHTAVKRIARADALTKAIIARLL